MTVQLSETQKISYQKHYEGLIQQYWEKTYLLKKEIVSEMKDDLVALGYTTEKIASKISKDLEGDISESYIHQLLGDEFKNQKYTPKKILWNDIPQQKNVAHVEHLNNAEESTKSPTEMDKEELRSYIESMEQRNHDISRELDVAKDIARKKNIALVSEFDVDRGSIGNKAVNDDSGTENLHSGQVSTPKYKITETEKIYQDIVLRAVKVLLDRVNYTYTEFVPNMKIESEEHAHRYAQAIMWFADFFKPVCDQKYRLSMIDWMKLIKWNMSQGPSASSKMMKKEIANIMDLDPKTLPIGFDKTVLALKIDEKTGQAIYVSPTKEHVDSRINFILDFLTTFINRMKFVGDLAEMQENEFKRRNFRAAVLSEKLTECK